MVYYGEWDPGKAQWLRELIKEGVIANGEVDERSILDVKAQDLKGFTQVHLFGGIGLWSYALRQAGWPDDRPVLTLSCPCQPFSAAGERRGVEDERHLWPVAFELIRELQPPVLFGEQVSSKDGIQWFDGVKADLNSAGYSVCGFDMPAAAFGAPHIRQRLYFVASIPNETVGDLQPVRSANRDRSLRRHEFGPAEAASGPSLP